MTAFPSMLMAEKSQFLHLVALFNGRVMALTGWLLVRHYSARSCTSAA